MKDQKNIKELFLSTGRYTLKTDDFKLTAEEQKLLIISLICSAKDMGAADQRLANGIFIKLTGVEPSTPDNKKVTQLFPEA